MRTFNVIALFVLGWLGPAGGLVRAGEKEAASLISVGLKGGVGLPQLNSSMDATFYVHLDLAYQFPVWDSRLGVVTAVGYSQPTASGTGTDPAVAGGTYGWEMTQRQTVWDLGLLLKFLPRGSVWNAGVMAGSRLTFLSVLTNGEAGGEPFGEHDERATVPGLFVGAQAEYILGPGALFAEVSVATAFEDLRTTGEVAVAEIGLLAGYRLTFSLGSRVRHRHLTHMTRTTTSARPSPAAPTAGR